MKISQASDIDLSAPRAATPRQRGSRSPRRLFTLLAAALILLAAATIASPAHGQTQRLVTYFNFNDLNETADPPGEQLTPTITQPFFNLTPTFVTPGSTLNIATGDPVTGTTGNSALRLTFNNNGGGNPKVFQFSVSTVGLTNLSLSYATRSSIAGITQTLSYSTNGGTTFSIVGTFVPTTTFSLASFNLPAAVNDQTSVIFRIDLSGAGANKGEFNEFDNIQLKGVPEPSTVAGGLLAVVGLSWHQRRRLLKARHLLSFRRKSST